MDIVTLIAFTIAYAIAVIVPGPGVAAVVARALGGGGMASLRNDALGKGMGQILLALPMRVGAEWLALLEASTPADHAAPGA